LCVSAVSLVAIMGMNQLVEVCPSIAELSVSGDFLNAGRSVYSLHVTEHHFPKVKANQLYVLHKARPLLIKVIGAKVLLPETLAHKYSASASKNSSSSCNLLRIVARRALIPPIIWVNCMS